jgi:hypothetical protein
MLQENEVNIHSGLVDRFDNVVKEVVENG